MKNTSSVPLKAGLEFGCWHTSVWRMTAAATTDDDQAAATQCGKCPNLWPSILKIETRNG